MFVVTRITQGPKHSVEIGMALLEGDFYCKNVVYSSHYSNFIITEREPNSIALTI
jgi:hypothetical protein